MTTLSRAAFSNLTDLTRKVASAMQDKRKVEQAFAEQVYTLMSNRAGPLMDPQYRLGFEVVHANDDFTEMFGLWAFRLDPNDERKLVYVPCFYRGGKVMADAAYNLETRQMRPLTPDQCKQLIEKSKKQDGQPIPRALSSKFRPNILFNRIVLGGPSVKRASGLTNEQLHEVLNDMATQLTEPARLLPQLAREIGSTKVANVILDLCEKNEKLAARIAKSVDLWDDVYTAPDPVATKQATAEDPALLAFYTRNTIGAIAALEGDERLKVASAVQNKGHWFHKGTTVQDNPPPFSKVYDASPEANQFIQVKQPGVYEVVKADGTTCRALVAKEANPWPLRDKALNPDMALRQLINDGFDSGYGYRSDTLAYGRGRQTPLRVIDLDHGLVWQGTQDIYTTTEKVQDDSGIKSVNDVKSGDFGVLYCPELKAMTPAMEIGKVVKSEGVTHLYGGYNSLITTVDAEQIAPLAYGVISGACWKFIPAKRMPKPEKEGNGLCNSPCVEYGDVQAFQPAGGDAITKLLAEGLPMSKKASLRHLGEDIYELQVGAHRTAPQSDKAILIKLAGQLCIEPEVAEYLVEEAHRRGRMDFGMVMPEKLASAMLRIVESPQWTESFDPVLNVKQQEPQSFVLRTERQQIFTPAGRVGDHYRHLNNGRNSKEIEENDNQPRNAKDIKPAPGSPSAVKSAAAPPEMLRTATPEELAQYAETSQDSVLDHGVLGAMANISDIEVYLSQYVPKIEEGVDYVGRCLFLLRVKPSEWVRLYGTDDLMEAEDRLTTTFRTMGELVLFLERRNTKARSEEDTKRY